MNKKLSRNTKGSSLIEVLVGGTIIAICAAMLVTGFITSYRLMIKSKQVDNKSQIAFSIIEGADMTDSDMVVSELPGGKMTYQLDSIQKEINGIFVSVHDLNENVEYIIFKSDSEDE